MPTSMPGWDTVHHLVEIVISLLEIWNFGSLRKKGYLEGRFQNSPDDSTLPNLGIRITVHLTRTSTARKEQIISVPQDNNDEIDTSSPPPWKFNIWKHAERICLVPIHHHQRSKISDKTSRCRRKSTTWREWRCRLATMPFTPPSSGVVTATPSCRGEHLHLGQWRDQHSERSRCSR